MTSREITSIILIETSKKNNIHHHQFSIHHSQITQIMSNPSAAVVTAKTTTNALITQGAPEQFNITAVEEMLDALEQARKRDIKKAQPASTNMVDNYLKFNALMGVPIRRFFMGWTARPLVDYKTKEPICDPETGEQLFGPAVIFFNPETDTMEVNQAFQILKTFHNHKPAKGTAVEITYKGLVPTERGNNQQNFSIVFLK